MYEFKKIGKVFKSKFVGTGPSSYKKEFTGPRLRNTALDDAACGIGKETCRKQTNSKCFGEVKNIEVSSFCLILYTSPNPSSLGQLVSEDHHVVIATIHL